MRGQGMWRQLDAGNTAAFLLLFAAASPLYLESARLLAVAAFIARAAAAALRLLGVEASAAANVLWTPRGGLMVTQECISTPLIPVYLAAVLAYSSTWRRRALGLIAASRWLARDQRPASLAQVPIIVTVAVAALVCSLSPERRIGPFTIVRPSGILYGLLPMFRAYARFGVMVQLMAALLAGIGVDHLRQTSTSRAQIVLVALLVLTVGEYAVWPPALWRDVLPTTAHRWIARQPDRLRVLDCAPLTPASASVQWLTGDQLSLLSGPFDDCTEPNLSQKLAAAGYTHLLVRRGTWDGRWFAHHPTPDGLRVQARFGDGEVFAVTAPPPSVYTAEMTAFSPREHDEGMTWRWMGPDASWTIVNRSGRPIVAALDIKMWALGGARGLELLLDRQEVQRLVIEERRRLYRVGPLALTPGDHAIVFHPTDPPTVADDLPKNGDRRPLSFAVGAWQWTVQGEQP
jgi:hypothetical protein